MALRSPLSSSSASFAARNESRCLLLPTSTGVVCRNVAAVKPFQPKPSCYVNKIICRVASQAVEPVNAARSQMELLLTNSSSTSADEPGLFEPDSVVSIESRVLGCILAAMCGNVLGAPLQFDRHWQVTRMFPDGITDFLANQHGETPLKLGQATGEFCAMLAVARSLVSAQTCDATQIATELATRCDPEDRRYPPYTYQLLGNLRSPSAMLQSVHYLASLPLGAAAIYSRTGSATATSFSDRPDREPYGPADHMAAVANAAPIAIAYRDAPWSVVEDALHEACLLSHAHPVGVDGARIMTAAVHWLLQHPTSTQQASSSNGNGFGNTHQEEPRTPHQLLQYLKSLAQTSDMQSKLELIEQQLTQVGEVQEIHDWRAFYRGRQWHVMTQVLTRLTYHDYATSGTEAAAVALWAFLNNWQHPRQALSTAAAFAGSSSAVCQLVGSLAGALHGQDWIPVAWWDTLENGQYQPSQPDESATDSEDEVLPERLRDEAVTVARQLAALQCNSVGLHNVSPSN